MINDKEGDEIGMKKRVCVGYIRINKNDDVVLNGQKNLIENFCKESGLQLKSIAIDCLSVSSERLELNRLLKESNKKEFDTVLIAYATRLSRDSVGFKNLLNEFKGNGVKVYSIAECRFC